MHYPQATKPLETSWVMDALLGAEIDGRTWKRRKSRVARWKASNASDRENSSKTASLAFVTPDIISLLPFCIRFCWGFSAWIGSVSATWAPASENYWLSGVWAFGGWWISFSWFRAAWNPSMTVIGNHYFDTCFWIISYCRRSERKNAVFGFW